MPNRLWSLASGSHVTASTLTGVYQVSRGAACTVTRLSKRPGPRPLPSGSTSAPAQLRRPSGSTESSAPRNDADERGKPTASATFEPFIGREPARWPDRRSPRHGNVSADHGVPGGGRSGEIRRRPSCNNPHAYRTLGATGNQILPNGIRSYNLQSTRPGGLVEGQGPESLTL